MKQDEIHAWELLEKKDPEDVCRCAGVSFNAASNEYRLPVLGFEVSVTPGSRVISGETRDCDLLLNAFGYFSRLSILRYLIHAENSNISGKWIKPTDLKGSNVFFGGSHALPLDRLAARFSQDPSAFSAMCGRFGGQPVKYGDAAMQLPVFPRIPVLVILWKEDSEFPARADLLLDSTCDRHLPMDIIWSIGMMTVLFLTKVE